MFSPKKMTLSKKEYELIKKECKPEIITSLYVRNKNDKPEQGYVVRLDNDLYYKAHDILLNYYNKN